MELQHRPNIDMHRPSVELQHRPSVELQHRPSIDLHRPSATQKPSLPPIPPARSGLQNMTVYCEAMYNFNAEYPEELSLEVSCYYRCFKLQENDMLFCYLETWSCEID